jgi:hypothetical protein
MRELFIILTIAAIVSQTVHTYFVFNSFSRLKGWLKLFQSIVFCGIISVAIFAFVIIENPALALLGAFVEVVINMYYYAMDFFENGIRARVHTRESILKFWRINWVAIFFGLLIPMLIYVFALQLLKL